MPKIRTVLGDKDPADMGHILPHEHTFFHLLGAPSDPASVFDRDKAVEEASAQLKGSWRGVWDIGSCRLGARRSGPRHGADG